MAFNGSGTFVRLYNWVSDALASIGISASKMDAEMDGFANALSNCVTRDGQGYFAAGVDVNANGNRLKNLANGTAAAPAVYAAGANNAGLYFPATGSVALSAGGGAGGLSISPAGVATFTATSVQGPTPTALDNSNKFATTAFVQAALTGSLFDASKTSSGYQKLPNGLILQWGIGSQFSFDVLNKTQSITFPIAFPNSPLAVLPGFQMISKATSGECYTATFFNQTTTGFTFYSTANVTGADIVQPVYFAIGY